MSIVNALKSSGYTPEKSTAGDRPILIGMYKCLFVDWKEQEDKGYGPSIRADFKVVEKLSGYDSRSTFPEFVGFFNTSEEKINSKRNGLAKLLNGFFSIGKNIDSSSDEAFAESMNALKGSAEVFIKGYKQEPVHQVDGAWVENPDGNAKQAFVFYTEKNAIKQAEKDIKAAGHPL